MNIAEIRQLVKAQIPEKARGTVAAYLMQLAASDRLKQQAVAEGVSPLTMNILTAAAPMLSAELAKLIDQV